MIINRRVYKLIKIYKKKHELQDVYLFRNVQTGVKECFQYFDLNLQHTEASIEERVKKTKKEMPIKESKPRFNIKF